MKKNTLGILGLGFSILSAALSVLTGLLDKKEQDKKINEAVEKAVSKQMKRLTNG